MTGPGESAVFAPPDPLLGILLRDALRLMQQDFTNRAAAIGIGLTPALFRVLFRLHREPGCRQVELAELLEVTPVTVGRMLDRLEKQQLVRRATHPDDRRATRVFLGRRGTALMTQLQDIAHQTEDRAFAGLSASERAAFEVALKRIRTNLSPSAATRRQGHSGGH